MTDWDEFLKDYIQEEKRKECKEKEADDISDKGSQRRAAERTTDRSKPLSLEARRSRKTKRDVIDLCDGSPPAIELCDSSSPVVVDLCDSSSSEEEEEEKEDAAGLPVVAAPQSRHDRRDRQGRFAANQRDSSGQAVAALDGGARRGSNATAEDPPANDIIERHRTKTVPSQNGTFEARRGPDGIKKPLAAVLLRRGHLRRSAASKRVSGQSPVTLDRAHRGSNVTEGRPAAPKNDIKRYHTRTAPSQKGPQNGTLEARRGPDGIKPLAAVSLRRNHLRRVAASNRVSNVTEGLPAAPNYIIKRLHTETVASLQCLQNNGMFEARGPDRIQAGKRYSLRHYVQEESSSADAVGDCPADDNMRFVKQCYVRSGSTLSSSVEITAVPTTGVTPLWWDGKIREEDSGLTSKRLLTVRGSTTHNVEPRPYACKNSNCGMSFAKADKLQDHVTRKHTRGKPYVCEECGQKFGNLGILKEHCKMHKVQKPRACKKCGKGFADADTLKDHVRVHTGGKPYTCKKCGHMFRAMHHFQKHMRAHSGDKPFPCPHCGKRFNNESYLTEHNIRKHAGEKPYSCGRCGRGFTASDDLMIHFRRCRAHTS